MKKVRCENRLCIYYRDNICTVEEIRLNRLGICEDCMEVEFTEQELSENREKLLQQLERQFGEK